MRRRNDFRAARTATREILGDYIEKVLSFVDTKAIKPFNVMLCPMSETAMVCG